MKEHQICEIDWLFTLHIFILSQRNYISLILLAHHICNEQEAFFVHCLVQRHQSGTPDWCLSISTIQKHAKSNKIV